ncbi:unnamed protein product [Choristocarpus tenellus]
MDDPEYDGNWYMRDLPYGWDTLMENLGGVQNGCRTEEGYICLYGSAEDGLFREGEGKSSYPSSCELYMDLLVAVMCFPYARTGRWQFKVKDNALSCAEAGVYNRGVSCRGVCTNGVVQFVLMVYDGI